jgi:hypothetical protein
MRNHSWLLWLACAVAGPVWAGPQCGFSTSFVNDGPTQALTGPQKALITLHVSEAGKRWTELLLVATPCNIEVEVRMDSNVATANAASTVSVLVGTVGPRQLYEQGVAHELRAGVDPNGSTADMSLVIGVGYLQDELWFDPDPAARTAPIPESKIDVFSVVLHELGHAIAYSGWADGQGNPPGDFYSVWDRWMLPGAPALFDGPRAKLAWGSQPELTTNNINHWGNDSGGPPAPESPAEAIQWQGGVPVPRMVCTGLHGVEKPVMTDSPAAPPPPSLLDQLMNGVAFYYQQRYVISELDIGVLWDTGLPVDDIVFENGFESGGE